MSVKQDLIEACEAIAALANGQGHRNLLEVAGQARRALEKAQENESEPVLILHLNAGNDTNGNPWRIFVVYDQGGMIIDTMDEGYAGKGEIGIKFSKVPITWQISTTPKEYRELLKM